MLRPFLVFVFLLSLLQAVLGQTPPTAPHLDRVLQLLSERLPSIRSYVEERESAPENAGWFRRSQSDIDTDLNRILDEILTMVIGQDYDISRGRLFEIENEIDRLEVAIGELRILRTTAPNSPEQLSPVDWAMRRQFAPGSKEMIDLQIAADSERRDTLGSESDALVNEFRTNLRDLYDIALTEGQARSLLYQINGGSIVETSVTFAALQQIQARFAEIRENTDNDEILRRYYGMSAALSLIAVRLHERHLAQYSSDWLPKIDELDAEQQSLIVETEDALDLESDAVRRASYENNLLIQRSVSDAIDEYRALLTDRQEIVSGQLLEAYQVSSLAMNTLRTLENAVVLHSQFTWNDEEFQALKAISDVALLPLDNEEITQRYLDLSRQIMTAN